MWINLVLKEIQIVTSEFLNVGSMVTAHPNIHTSLKKTFSY